MLDDSLLTTSTTPPSPPPPPLRGGILLEEDAIFDKPHSPPWPTSARVLEGAGVHATSRLTHNNNISNSNSKQSRKSSRSNSSGSSNGNGRPCSPQPQRDFHPFPTTRPVQHRLPSPKTTASNLKAMHRVRHMSPMQSRSNAVPHHVHVQRALEYLKEDIERTQHQLRLHQQKQSAEYGPDRKTEIFIDSLLQEELIKPVRRATRVHQENSEQHRPSRAITRSGSPSPSLESNNSDMLRASYPLTRKDAKKRKEARFRISNNGRTTPVTPTGRAPRRYQHQHPSHRPSRSLPVRTPFPRQVYHPGRHHKEVYNDVEDDDNGSIITPPLQHLRRLKYERDAEYRISKSHGRQSASESVTSYTRMDKAVSAERLVDNLVNAFSCNAVDNVLATAHDSCAPFGNDVTEDDPSIITLEDSETVETAEYESDTAVVQKSSSRNSKSISRISPVHDPSVSVSSTQPAMAELLKLRKELNDLQLMSSHQSQQQQQQPIENDRRHWRDDDEESLVTKEHIRIAVTPSSAPKPRPKKSVHFAAPCVTLIKHRPFTDPDDIEKLYFVSEELDEYEYDRETTDGEQFEMRLIEKKKKPLSRVEEGCVDSSVENCPDDEILEQHHQEDSFTVSVSYQNRPRLPFDPADDLMLSPSDLSALHQDSNSLASMH